MLKPSPCFSVNKVRSFQNSLLILRSDISSVDLFTRSTAIIQMKNLVIVESPNKVPTIQKFLGSDYKVMSSVGHIRDLKKKGISIDFDNNFSPEYEVPAEKKDLVNQLKKAAKEADTVWLASDEDREGEAIAWHLAEVLNLDPATTRRIVFHEITKPALLHAIENPRHIDLDKVNAQQARRVLDRIVGFELSPVLWRKIKPALSAGRVQSATLRLICEREKEIDEFKSEPYFRITGSFLPEGSKKPIKAELNRRLADEQETKEFLKTCASASFEVSNVEVHPVKRSPLPPFTTSTLLQEASNRLGFSVKRTTSLAQKLYEAGFITYIRTDSTNLSELAIADIAKNIESTYGKEYLHTRHYHTHSKGAQEAHEAIRPTYVSNRTIDGDAAEKKLYELIWSRAVASQMADAELEKTNVDITISNAPELFKAEGSVVTFPGFMKAYMPEKNEDSRSIMSDEMLPKVEPGEPVTPKEIQATQKYTLAPPRFTERALIKKMEELGIGRPSTYNPTISTIQDRDYIRKGDKEGTPREYTLFTLSKGKITKSIESENTGSDKGKLVPTDTGMIVNDFLTEYFPEIIDYNFTAKIESKFDEIAEGETPWQEEIESFYKGFHPEIEKINSMKLEHKVGERQLGTDPKTGKPVSVKIGRFGPIVQLGSATDEEKPQFAGLEPGQSIATLTLEEALKLFELPRTVGEYEGKKVVAAVGRFGPYIRHNSAFVSIPKDLSPLSISLEEAIELIENKRQADANKFIKEFEEMPGLQILNGRFGPYIAYKAEGAKKGVNYKIPKGQDPSQLTLEEVKKLMEAQDAAPKKRTTRAKK